MSDADNNSYAYTMGSEGFQIPFSTDHNFTRFMHNHPLQNPTGMFHLSGMSYTDFFHGSAAFDLSHSSSNKNLGETSSSAAETPNSSVSFPSSDAGVEEEDSRSNGDEKARVCEGGEDQLKSNKV